MICGVVATSSASAYSVYDAGNISTTYVQYFEDIVDGETPLTPYVMWRNGQYEYIIAFSDGLKVLNGTFSSNENTRMYSITQTTGTNGRYSLNYSESNNFELTTNKSLLYSSLEGYPSLNEGSEVFLYAMLVISVVGGCCVLIRPIFKFVLRSR